MRDTASSKDVTIAFSSTMFDSFSSVEHTVALAGWGATPGERVHYNISSEYPKRWSMSATDTLSCENVSYDWHLYPTAPPLGTDSLDACEVRLNFSVQFNSILLLPGWDMQRLSVIEDTVDAFLRRAMETEGGHLDGDDMRIESESRTKIDDCTNHSEKRAAVVPSFVLGEVTPKPIQRR